MRALDAHKALHRLARLLLLLLCSLLLLLIYWREKYALYLLLDGISYPSHLRQRRGRCGGGRLG